MLTVWTLCWGDKYDPYYVQRLQREVKKNLTIPHRFVCITEQSIEGVATVPPINGLPGWWGKVNVFVMDTTEQNLFLDLDVVITGNLDALVDEYGGCYFAAAKNWAQSGHGGVQSSVMLWQGGTGCHAETIYRNFDPAIAHWPPINTPGVLWGDQEHCTQLRDEGKLSVTAIDPALIKSYKYHVRPNNHKVPAGAMLIIFHGKPDPHEITGEDWLKW